MQLLRKNTKATSVISLHDRNKSWFLPDKYKQNRQICDTGHPTGWYTNVKIFFIVLDISILTRYYHFLHIGS